MDTEIKNFLREGDRRTCMGSYRMGILEWEPRVGEERHGVGLDV